MADCRLKAVFGALVVVTFAACAPRPADDGEDLSPLRVEYTGCVTVIAGPSCVPSANGMLTLWIPTDQVTFSPSALAAPAELDATRQGGYRYRVRLRAEARELVISAADGRRFRLGLQTLERPAAVAEVLNALREQALDEVVEKASAALASVPEVWHGALHGALGRAAFFRGDIALASEHLARAARASAQHDRLADEVSHSTVLVHALLTQRRFAEAREWLHALPTAWGGPAQSDYFREYYLGLTAFYVGDARSALRHLGAAHEQAERLPLAVFGHNAGQVLSEQLQRVGRRAQAERLLAQLLAEHQEELRPCDRAQLLNNLGWGALLALEAGEGAQDPAPVFEEALTLFESDCPMILERPNVLVNLALADLHGKRLEQAQTHLEQARGFSADAPLRLVLWQRDLAARLALAQGRADEALTAYDALRRVAEATLSHDVAWRATVGRAQALAALGRQSDALDAFAEADRSLARESLQVPVHAGRESFLARRQWALREHLQLLLETGADEEAFAQARRARIRFLLSVHRGERLHALTPEERAAWDDAMAAYQAQREALVTEASDDWQLAGDELRRLGAERALRERELRRQLDDALALLDRGAPAASRYMPAPRRGELLLLFHPTAKGWVGFAHDGRRLRTVPLPCDPTVTPASDLGACLLAPFAQAIDAADSLRILAYGSLRAVDFHALPYGEDLLVAHRPLVYGMDLEQITVLDGAWPTRALVVADPRGDLPAARTELADVTGHLQAFGWQVTTREGEAVDGAVLRSDLPGVDLLHYAGHAVYAGEGGWDSALPLAGNASFDIGDILTLGRAPDLVVLSGCETGRVSSAETPESLGLAQAFVAAGSRAVIAATRPVDDHTAAAFVRHFYERLVLFGADQLAVSLRDAQLTLRSEDPSSDWASFRLIVP